MAGPVRVLSDKVCPQCGVAFRPRHATSKFCGEACAFAARQPVEPRSWRHNDDGYLVGEFCVRGVRHHVYQHRMAMERLLGRPLEAGEVVHHINGVRDDNRPENLELRERVEHVVDHLTSGKPRKRGYRLNVTDEQRQIWADRMRQTQPWRFSKRYRDAHPDESGLLSQVGKGAVIGY